jgi:hypothetical protein
MKPTSEGRRSVLGYLSSIFHPLIYNISRSGCEFLTSNDLVQETQIGADLEWIDFSRCVETVAFYHSSLKING